MLSTLTLIWLSLPFALTPFASLGVFLCSVRSEGWAEPVSHLYQLVSSPSLHNFRDGIKVLISKAKALEDMKQYENARSVYEQAILFYPTNANTHACLGKVLYELGDYNKARDAYKQAIYLDSSQTQAYEKLNVLLVRKANTLVARELYEEAYIAFEQAILFNPDNIRLYPNQVTSFLNKGKALCMHKQFKDALGVCNIILLFNPNNKEAHIIKGEILNMLGRHQEAYTVLRIASKLTGSSFEEKTDWICQEPFRYGL